MRIPRTVCALLPVVLLMEGCDPRDEAAIARAVTTSQLMNVRNSLRVWRELENQEVQEESVYEIVAQSIVSQVLMIRAVDFEVEELKGASLEALCLLTTDEVKQILRMSDDDELSQLAVDYIESIKDDVQAYVREVQETMLGTGCSLSPGEPHF